jgi:hypothetical protein
VAHEVETMFSARLTPWHRLGVVTPDVLTAEDAIVAAGLDWKVEKNQVFKQKAVITEDGVGTEYADVGITTERNRARKRPVRGA